MSKFRIAGIVITCFAAIAFISYTSTSANNRGKAVTFSKEVAPILFKSCAECHRPGETAPFSVLSYKDVRPWAKSIREKVTNRTMPPWHADPHVGEFKNDRRLAQAEIDTIAAWVEGGAAEGDAKDLPPAPKYVDGWTIGKPDIILQMREEAVLAASGPDEYQYFVIPTNFTEDKYVQMAEARPGNRKIVHHILALVMPPSAPGGKDFTRMTQDELQKVFDDGGQIFYREGYLRRVKMDAPVNDDGCNGKFGEDDAGDVIAGYAPGMPADVLPAGVAKRVPAGSLVILQVHYSKVAGTEQKDRSTVGLIFAKEPPRKQMIKRGIENVFFKIPAGAAAHQATACWKIKEDITLYSLMPHMHYRGAAMEFEAAFPDGKTEKLLHVPNYDFGWQTVYELKTPRFIPRGTKIQVTATFNNSAKNRYNPDPTKVVRWGDPTYDEMLIGYIDYTPERKAVAGLDAKTLDGFTGKYNAGFINLTIVRSGNRLFAEMKDQPRIELLPEEKDKFFVREMGGFVTFVKNENGEVTEASIEMGGRAIRGKKVKDATANGNSK
ncbi:MAG: DUF3471 domain-containing protein [Blastocatellia bacterium]